MKTDLAKRIRDNYSKFTKTRRRIANAILNNYDKIADMNASQFAAYVNTAESTITRFAQLLGYEKYSDFRLAVTELASKKLTPTQRISIARQKLDDVDVIKGVMDRDVLRIRQTMLHLDRDAFRDSIGAIMCAKNIFVVGARSSEALAVFASYNLSLIFDNVRPVRTTGGPEVYEQMFFAKRGDVVIAFSFPRYSSQVIKAVKMAKANGACCIVVTDAETSPLTEYATYLLVAKVGMASFSDSIAAPISIINAMIIELTNRMGLRLEQRFDQLERLWQENQIYL